jgi:hypothetical protein
MKAASAAIFVFRNPGLRCDAVPSRFVELTGADLSKARGLTFPPTFLVRDEMTE